MEKRFLSFMQSQNIHEIEGGIPIEWLQD